MTTRRPVIGVLCCNEVAARPVQVVASRFVEPLSILAAATVLLVPAIAEVTDMLAVSHVLDGLLLTGSRSHVAPRRYGGTIGSHILDEERDEVALALAARMIEAGKPVYGICRGLQEINVLFGGTLSSERCSGRHHSGSWDAGYDTLFDHRHEVVLTDGGLLSIAANASRLTVNSVHEQGIDQLGFGLSVEALASDDGLIEAFSANPCGGDVLAVQWHPEWDAGRSPGSRAFFTLIGASLRRSAGLDVQGPATLPYLSRSTIGGLRGH
ncbi:gamma-glutamyl-gamma-aminobutyrate hydrolase family protein [Sphingomonas bacterium]|uniref:gamma-glutamyl-gamma-aminobutyrate hydrolase family protein n=1 Tax=Sphingomonas bacterium TaxID=1895847 RepID=UPI0015767BB0|nr:gamma-glutamyl-gamma-aminobutyrate hydrolase family protein [Sphingomonas bacterium]